METFNVIVEGNVLPGFEKDQVSSELAKLINQSEEFAKKLLHGNETTIKSGVDSKTGDVYLAALRRIGVACFVAPQKLEIDIGLTPVIPNTKPSSDLPIQQEYVSAPSNSKFGASARTGNYGSQKTVDRSVLSKKWQTRFALIDKAGGPSLLNTRNLSYFERIRMQGNFLAILFGPFYYLAKGMWLRALTLLFIGMAIYLWSFILFDLFLPQYLGLVAFIAWVPYSLFPAYANVDYYRAFNEPDIKRWTGFWISLVVGVIATGASLLVIENESSEDFSRHMNQVEFAERNLFDYLRSVFSSLANHDVNASASQVLDQIYGPYNKKLECWLDEENSYCMKLDRVDQISTTTGKRIYILAAGHLVDEKGEENSIHAAPGQVGAFVVEEQKDRLVVVASDPRLSVGDWGIGPTKWKLVKVGTGDYWGWHNKWGGGNGGESMYFDVILAPKGDAMILPMFSGCFNEGLVKCLKC